MVCKELVHKDAGKRQPVQKKHRLQRNVKVINPPAPPPLCVTITTKPKRIWRNTSIMVTHSGPWLALLQLWSHRFPKELCQMFLYL
jgi:hypothetical protein